jgi:hypothetical protein
VLFKFLGLRYQAEFSPHESIANYKIHRTIKEHMISRSFKNQLKFTQNISQLPSSPQQKLKAHWTKKLGHEKTVRLAKKTKCVSLS